MMKPLIPRLATGLAFYALLVACHAHGAVPPRGGLYAESLEKQSPTSGAYAYLGAQIYPVDDWFTTNLQTGGSAYAVNSIDPNSSAIVRYIASIYGNINWYSPAAETANAANGATPMHAVNGCLYGCYDDPYLDDSFTPIEYPVTTPEYEQGQASGGCTGDCHDITINLQTGIDYEAYTSGSRNWNPSTATFTTEDMTLYNLSQPYDAQRTHGCCTAAGLPLMGTTDWGEDSRLASIDHSVGFLMPVTGQASGGRVAPAPRAAVDCSSDCSYELPYGARLLLHSWFACPPAGSNPQANLVCNQLKTYGMILQDTQSGSCRPKGTGSDQCRYGLRMGKSADGTNPWNGDGCECETALDLNALFFPSSPYYLHITDFDVMTLGPITR